MSICNILPGQSSKIHPHRFAKTTNAQLSTLLGLTILWSADLPQTAAQDNYSVVAWGNLWNGSSYVSPAAPDGLTNAVAIVAGRNHCLALKRDGSVAAWGYTSNGSASIPTTVPEGLDRVAALAAGSSHHLALRSDGTVVACPSDVPVQNTVPVGLNGVIAIAAGDSHSLALKSDGTVVAWGSNAFGEAIVPRGLNSVAAIGAGGYHNLALRLDGTVVAWGKIWNGSAWVDDVVPDGIKDVVAIAAGHSHSVALKSDSTVIAWGDNRFGQTAVPAGLNGLVAISAGNRQNLALQANGTVVTWGETSAGPSTVPSELKGVAAIGAGSDHSVALVGGTSRSIAPSILLQPLSQSVYRGSAVVLKVDAVGQPIKYQWRQNGINIVGATRPVYGIANAQSADAGQYSVVVTNPHGSVTSSNAVLGVERELGFEFNRTNYSTWEFAPAAELIVRRADANTPAASIRYTTRAGTATPGADYVESAGTLEFASGELEKSIVIRLLDDQHLDDNRAI